jgi:hypothetical protein
MPAKEVNDPASPRANGIGPFMLFRREAYERIGGHEAVRAEVIEDLKLAEIVKRGGHGLLLVRGTSLAAVRMYDSLPAIVRGWSKNFHVALGRAFALAPLFAAGILLLFAGPFVVPPLALLAGDHAALGMGLAALAALVAGRADLARRYGIGIDGIAATPLGASVIAFILLRSAFRAATGRRFVWKGREV